MQIPFHGKGTPLDKINLWGYMASLNPKGFRNASTKKNRRSDRKSKKLRYGRFLTHPEKLARGI